MKFEMQMGESEALIREGLRIEDLSKRIQEQNEYAFIALAWLISIDTDSATVNF